ncbi:antiviral reverse transcriptase Drt3b [Rhizobium leguminosarum]|uniref:antiviral reverse transcriptase Drt3b n=1 Tax=Rhizobium leguminosarum TaxID=384 RepID=UPI003F9CD659
MSKLKYIKGNLRRGDYVRSILTDTSPYEVPLIVSNDGFYTNITKINSFNEHNIAVINGTIANNNETYTVPYRYTITKDNATVRRLSLIHPASQFAMAKFYKKYDSLICYFSSLAPFSIRFPHKVGSSFFFTTPIADANKYRYNKIDTTDIDKFVRNPASYFAYSGFDRLYKFYGSSTFVRLEKKYPLMALMDVSKCFDSIYSHSVSWAIKSAENSKKNVTASSFGNDFDKLMQASNYNETNGICIGPEVSRIFAEIILQRIDLEIVKEAKADGIVFGRDFECKRYVDDYILFSKSENIQKKVVAIASHCLSQFNLHLNEQKLQYFDRPFLTPKSHIVHATKVRLTRLFETIVELRGQNLLLPKRIFRTGAFVKSFISSIKSGCFEENVSYDMVANYVIASLSKRIDRLIQDFDGAIQLDPEVRPYYQNVILVFLELIFFFYTVNPTVASSYNVSRSMILASRFIRDSFPEDFKAVSGQAQEWVNEFIRSSSSMKRSSARAKVPIEVLNVLIASFEFGPSNSVTENWLIENVVDVDHLEYFSIVSCLYYIKARPAFANLRTQIEEKIKAILANCANVKRTAHDAYLALDALSCPYLSLGLRRKILSDLRKSCSLPNRDNASLEVDLGEFAASPWFVQWDSLDMMNMIRKKELSAVY